MRTVQCDYQHHSLKRPRPAPKLITLLAFALALTACGGAGVRQTGEATSTQIVVAATAPLRSSSPAPASLRLKLQPSPERPSPTHGLDASACHDAYPGPAAVDHGGRQQLVFRSVREGPADLFLLSGALGKPVITRVTKTPSTEEHPVWSPNGYWIAFASVMEPVSRIYRVRPDGSELSELTQGLGFNHQPTWSPDGTRIAFIAHRGIDIADLYVMCADGSQTVALTKNPRGTSAGSPHWSPDGGSIYISYQGHLAILELATLEITILARDIRAFTISPDGQQVIFSTDRDGNVDLYQINRDGTDERRLTTSPLADEGPAWSPDGRYVAFIQSEGGKYYVRMIEVESGQLFPLVEDGQASLTVRWSADSQVLAYGDPFNHDLVLLNIGTGYRTRVPKLFAESFAWSPQ